MRGAVLALVLLSTLAQPALAEPNPWLAPGAETTPPAPPRYRPSRGVPRVASLGSSAAYEEARRFLGRGNPTGFRGEWCKAFTNMVLRRVGMHPSASLMARDALRDGRRVASPRVGDLAIVLGGRHVTFFAGYGGRGLLGLGGNQGRSVRLSSYPLRSVVGYVEPE